MNPATTIVGLAAAALFAAAAPAQAAFLPFGTGCTFNGQTPAIGNQGLPRIGTTFTVTYTGPNFTFNSGQQIAQPIFVLGFGAQAVVLPTTFLPQQPAGCTGYLTPDFLVPMDPDRSLPVFVDHIDLPVPPLPALIGLQLYGQWATLVQQCGFAGCGDSALITSDAAVIVLGA